MDFPGTYQGTSPLESFIWENSSASKSSFNTSFLQSLTTTYGKSDNLKYKHLCIFPILREFMVIHSPVMGLQQQLEGSTW